MKMDYLKKYIISSYVLVWLLIIFVAGTASLVFHAPPVVMWIVRNLIAWSPTYLLLLGWKHFRPDETRKNFVKRCFSGKIKPLLLLFSFMLVFGISLLALFVFSCIEGKTMMSHINFGTTPLTLSVFLSFTSGPTGEELGWRGFMREEFNKRYGFLRSSIFQGLVWCFWHTLLWIVDSEFTDWRAVPYIISNIVVITSITVLMNIFLERHNNLLYSALMHFGFNIIYVFLDADIGFFVILTVLYLAIAPIAVLIRKKQKGFLKGRNMKKYIWIFLLCCLPLSNILWYIAYSTRDESVSTSLVILISFFPALTSLVLCKISKEGWDNLMVLPNIRKAWKVYLFAVAGALAMNYLNELLMYLMFMGEVSCSEGAFTLHGLGEVLGMTILGVLASVEMLGEELGWLGWLFPKLEKLHGTKAAMLFLALIRTVWHLGILVFFQHPLIGLCDLFLSNLLSQGFLVYLTKKSSSLFPAAVVHAVTNLLPSFVAYSDSFYQAHIVPMNCAGLISAFAVGGISCLLMRREGMFVQGMGTGKKNKKDSV